MPALQDHQQLAGLRQLGLAGTLQQLLDSPCGLGRLMRQAPMLVSGASLRRCHCHCLPRSPAVLAPLRNGFH